MDDSSIQYRIRLAQINGIKLDEASMSPAERRAATAKRLADVAHTYHSSMITSLQNGHTSSDAHLKAIDAVTEKHGQRGLNHLHKHLSQLGPVHSAHQFHQFDQLEKAGLLKPRR
jgi:hypothetical protein